VTDLELLTATKRYRAAYFAYHMLEMQINQEYERLRRSGQMHEDSWDASLQTSFDARAKLYRDMRTAEWALVEDPPAEYAAMIAELMGEFDDDDA
jgi:hypothetical protein